MNTITINNKEGVVVRNYGVSVYNHANINEFRSGYAGFFEKSFGEYLVDTHPEWFEFVEESDVNEQMKNAFRDYNTTYPYVVGDEVAVDDEKPKKRGGRNVAGGRAVLTTD